MARQTYLIQCGKYGAIKIGSTVNNIERRLKALQACCPYELKILHVLKGIKFSEQRLHYTFDHLRIRGEWFQYSGSLKAFIKDPDPSRILGLKQMRSLKVANYK